VTAPRRPGRDDDAVDALVADRYLDALLAARYGAAAPVGAPHALEAGADGDDRPPAAGPDPALAEAARVLRRSLVRVHPSFRFEERLAARLADLAAVQSGRATLAAGGAARVIPFPGGAGATAADPRAVEDPLLPAILAGHLDPTDEAALDRATPGFDRRPLLVGGALTSAALSIVGVAWVAWRASRPAARSGARNGAGRAAATMARAARTAHARRAAAAALDGAGLTGGTA
jgi:hypothetical protein